MAFAETMVALRVRLVSPPSGILYCLRRTGRDDCVAHTRSTGGDLTFDLDVRANQLGSDGRPNFLGTFVQGPRGTRHIEICIGTLAGDKESCWTRAAKIPLTGITQEMVEQAAERDGLRLEASFAGTARNGGPACATLALLENWTIVRA